MLQGSLFGSMLRTGICRHASWVSGSAYGRQFHAFPQTPTIAGALSGLIRSSKIETHLRPSLFGNLAMKLGCVRGVENVPLSCALNFRSFIHSGEHTEVEAEKDPGSTNHEQVITQESASNARRQLIGELDAAVRNQGSTNFDRATRVRVNTRPPLENEAGQTPTSIDFYQSLLRGAGVNGGLPLRQPDVGAGGRPRSMDNFQGGFRGRGSGPRGPREGSGSYPQLEANADIVHIKLMRNNSYVTLTDHRGNKKLSVSAGQVAAKGDKPGRYSGETAAEYMGRAVKQMRIRTVVVKVSGFTFFKRKRDAILAFKDGYTHSRGDVNPIVYIEDTTRKPHNGCRLPKSRRI